MGVLIPQPSYNVYSLFRFCPPGRPRVANPPPRRHAPPLPLGRPQIPFPLPERNEEIANKIKGYWDSPKAKELFCPSSPGEEGTDIVISSRIDLLQKTIVGKKKIQNIVNKADQKGCELSPDETQFMQTKMMYLHNAYLAALEYLPSKKTWKQCCEVAIRELNAVGIDKINNPETIMRWNGMFRN